MMQRGVAGGFVEVFWMSRCKSVFPIAYLPHRMAIDPVHTMMGKYRVL